MEVTSRTHQGQVGPAPDTRVGIVVSRFNDLITQPLLQGALSALVRHGGSAEQTEVAWVPGAFELPLAADRLAATGRFGAIVCLGCVIRGATSHYDYVCGQTAAGILQVGLKNRLPVIFGVLTTDTLEQAFERAGSKGGNKGAEAMEAALEMMDLLRRVEAG